MIAAKYARELMFKNLSEEDMEIIKSIGEKIELAATDGMSGLVIPADGISMIMAEYIQHEDYAVWFDDGVLHIEW